MTFNSISFGQVHWANVKTDIWSYYCALVLVKKWLNNNRIFCICNVTVPFNFEYKEIHCINQVSKHPRWSFAARLSVQNQSENLSPIPIRVQNGITSLQCVEQDFDFSPIASRTKTNFSPSGRQIWPQRTKSLKLSQRWRQPATVVAQIQCQGLQFSDDWSNFGDHFLLEKVNCVLITKLKVE